MQESFGGVTFIRGMNNGRYPYCHSVFVEEAGLLFDPASDRDRLTCLSKEGRVKTIWLTHFHEDHFAHLDLFDELPLGVSPHDTPPMDSLDNFLDWYGFEREEERTFWKPIMTDLFHFRPRKPSVLLLDGQILDLGSITVEVVATPGHTPGHLAFLFHEPSVLFMGDYDLTSFGPWYGDRFSSIEDTLASIERLKEIPASVWLTGHDQGIFKDDAERALDQYRDIIFEREEKIYRSLSKPYTLDELQSLWIIYGHPREPKAFFEFAERALLKKHVDALVRKGLVIEDQGNYARLR